MNRKINQAMEGKSTEELWYPIILIEEISPLSSVWRSVPEGVCVQGINQRQQQQQHAPRCGAVSQCNRKFMLLQFCTKLPHPLDTGSSCLVAKFSTEGLPIFFPRLFSVLAFLLPQFAVLREFAPVQTKKCFVVNPP